MASELRQRKKNPAGEEGKDEGAFAKHAKQDVALKQDEPQTEGTGTRKGLTVLGKLAVFLGFPSMIGFISLYLAFMRNKANGLGETVDLDTDFVFPFLLSLSLAIVVGFQTKGFTTREVKPLVSWPKVRRKKTIIHKRVVVDDDTPAVETEKVVEKKKKKATRKED